MTLRIRLKRLRRYVELEDADYLCSAPTPNPSLSLATEPATVGPVVSVPQSWSVLQQIPGLILSPDTFLPDTLEQTETLDDMMRFMDRLDGRFRKSPRNRHLESNDDLLKQPCRSFDTQDTEADDTGNANPAATKKRTIRWADEQADETACVSSTSRTTKLITVYKWHVQADAIVRVVCLLLHPANRKFEFIHAEYDNMEDSERVSVRDVLRQLGPMASNPLLKKMRYTALCSKGQEMIHCLALQEYNLQEGELVIAVPEGFSVKKTLAQATELLRNKALIRIVRKARVTGRALQKLSSSQQMAEHHHHHHHQHQHPEDDTINVDDESTTENSTDDDDDDDDSEVSVGQQQALHTKEQDRSQQLAQDEERDCPESSSSLQALFPHQSLSFAGIIPVPSLQDGEFDTLWAGDTSSKEGDLPAPVGFENIFWRSDSEDSAEVRDLNNGWAHSAALSEAPDNTTGKVDSWVSSSQVKAAAAAADDDDDVLGDIETPEDTGSCRDSSNTGAAQEATATEATHVIEEEARARDSNTEEASVDSDEESCYSSDSSSDSEAEDEISEHLHATALGDLDESVVEAISNDRGNVNTSTIASGTFW